MSGDRAWQETLIKKNVTYHIEFNGRLFLVENVPARVNVETGERHFSPETVERLHQAAWERCRPFAPSRPRFMSTPFWSEGSVFST